MELSNKLMQESVRDEFVAKTICKGNWLNHYRLIAALLMASSAAISIALVRWIFECLA